MNEEHIIDLLDSDSFARLSDEHRSLIERHIVHCAECRTAYASAGGAALLLRARAAQKENAGAAKAYGELAQIWAYADADLPAVQEVRSKTTASRP